MGSQLYSYLTEVEDLIDDGTKEISMAINPANREQIVLSNRQLKLTDSNASFFGVTLENIIQN